MSKQEGSISRWDRGKKVAAVGVLGSLGATIALTGLEVKGVHVPFNGPSSPHGVRNKDTVILPAGHVGNVVSLPTHAEAQAKLDIIHP